jgi:hypothetical protein
LALRIALTCFTSNSLFIDNVHECNCNIPRASTSNHARITAVKAIQLNVMRMCICALLNLLLSQWSRIKPQVSYAMCSTTSWNRVSFNVLSLTDKPFRTHSQLRLAMICVNSCLFEQVCLLCLLDQLEMCSPIDLVAC